ncbi:MAG: hypothetical protein AAB535_02145 [Patescibacteria group bacterium]
MRREIFLHFTFWFSFFVFVTLINKFFNLSYWLFWVGGLFGTILPDIDHLLYLYLRPQELTAQRVTLLYETRGERRDLIFHTAFFQIIFLVLTFWMITSSGSLFGKGLVLAFSLHLLIDQIVDLVEMQNFSNWLKNFPWNLDLNQAKIYWLGMVLLLCLFGFLL